METKKTRINHKESPEMVIWILKNIINALKTPNSTYTAKPGIQYFKSIEGKQKEHSFKIEHFPPSKRCEPEQLYASYDNFEFLCKIDQNIFSQFCTINEYIERKYIYDMNTDTYVLRPAEKTSSINTFLQWWRSRKR